MGNTLQELSPEGLDFDDAAVREQFNEIVSEDGRSLMQIAPETGIAYGTLSAWKLGKYSGNNERITAQVHGWIVTREARTRTRATVPQDLKFICTQTASAILDVLEAAHTLPDMAVIAGAAGIGKTTAAKRYQRAAANVWMATMMPSHSTMTPVLNAIGDAMGINHTSSSAVMAGKILRRLSGTRGLLIVDEAQNLSPNAIDQIRTFHDQAEIGIALVGNETVATRFGRDRLSMENAPLFSRIGQRFRQKNLPVKDLKMLIDAFDIDDEGARAVALQVGRAPGAARGMSKVLRLAFMLAAADHRTKPVKSDVEAAWEQLGNRAEGGTA